MNSRLFYFILCCFLICSCKEEETTVDASLIWEIDPTDTRKMDLSQFIDSIWLVPLETNDSCLIKKVHLLDYKFDNFYIENDVKEVQVYAQDGRFLYGTAKYLGGGPNDYTSAIAFRALSVDSIEIYDALSYKMRYFVHPLGFVSSLELPKDVLPSSLYAWVNGDTCVFSTVDPTNPMLKVYSKQQGKIIERIEDKIQKQAFLITSEALYKVDDVIFHSATYPSNDLYVLTKDADKELVCRLDFGSHNFRMEDLPEGLTQKYYYDYMESHPEYAYPYQKFISGEHYLAFFQYDGKMCMAYKYGKDGKTFLFRNEPQKTGQLMVPHHVSGDKLYYASEPMFLPYLVDTTLMSREDVVKMEKVDEMDNPIIVIYRMRSDL